MMPSFESFIKGHKPAIYENSLCPLFSKVLPDLLLKYPFINGDNIALNDEGETYLFFDNEELKESFENQLSDITKGSLEFHRLLGRTLGYPPKAVDFYIHKEVNSQLSQRSVGLYYMGVNCSSDVLDLDENCQWLWEHYPSHEQLQIRIDSSFYKVDYCDFDRLHQLKRLAKVAV
ncbi:hypothetical protein [Thermoflavimicrobium daqui]|jgi:hypothetical protein|uniref:Uncharacterized protein n=1 Tax=Thermoflavimicrobium daqui TaxID=2137476 RepID=A0A364K1V0_9BACL|nr:hypothetical protein [Thermoflavimicrobium daqui]RAL22001.1 hypothetical protein DL897_15580 [Thermoflavimicrobium daqui]